MAEAAKPTVHGLIRSNGVWGIEVFDQMLEVSAEAVGIFVEELPEDKREAAIEAIAERLRICRGQLETSKATETEAVN